MATDAPVEEEGEPAPEDTSEADGDAEMLHAISNYLGSVAVYLAADDNEAWKGSPLDDIEMKALRASILAGVSRATRILKADQEAA